MQYLCPYFVHSRLIASDSLSQYFIFKKFLWGKTPHPQSNKHDKYNIGTPILFAQVSLRFTLKRLNFQKKNQNHQFNWYSFGIPNLFARICLRFILEKASFSIFILRMTSVHYFWSFLSQYSIHDNPMVDSWLFTLVFPRLRLENFRKSSSHGWDTPSIPPPSSLHDKIHTNNLNDQPELCYVIVCILFTLYYKW